MASTPMISTGAVAGSSSIFTQTSTSQATTETGGFATLLATEKSTKPSLEEQIAEFQTKLEATKQEKAEHAKQMLEQLFLSAGIDTTTPLNLRVDVNGNVTVSATHPDKDKIEALLSRYGGIVQEVNEVADIERLQHYLNGEYTANDIEMEFNFTSGDAVKIAQAYEDLAIKTLLKYMDEMHRAYEARNGRDPGEAEEETSSVFGDEAAATSTADTNSVTGMASDLENELFSVIDEYGTDLSAEAKSALKAEVTKAGTALMESRISIQSILDQAKRKEAEAEAVKADLQNMANRLGVSLLDVSAFFSDV